MLQKRWVSSNTRLCGDGLIRSPCDEFSMYLQGLKLYNLTGKFKRLVKALFTEAVSRIWLSNSKKVKEITCLNH